MSVTTVKQIAGDVAALTHDDGGTGSYLTDGVDLYRVLGPLDVPGSAERMVALEECRTLDVILVARDELEQWRMRPILASAS